MKPGFLQICVFGIAVFSLQETHTEATEIKFFGHSFSCSSPLEVEQLTRETEKHIQQTLEDILAIPHEQRSFENTLMPWRQLSHELGSIHNQLNALATEHSLSSACMQSMQDLQVFFTRIFENSEVYKTVLGCAKNSLNNPRVNSIQRGIATNMLEQKNRLIQAKGKIQEEYRSFSDFSFLELKGIGLSRERAPDLANGILATNADLLCVHAIRFDEAIVLYDLLQKDFSDFLYLDACTTTLAFPQSVGPRGIFIASKCTIDQARFTGFSPNSERLNEGFIDFVVKNSDKLCGHIYLANLQQNASAIDLPQQFISIVEKIQGDVLSGQESVPLFMCGDFSPLKASNEGRVLLKNYFGPEVTTHLSLLLSSPYAASEILSAEYTVSSRPFVSANTTIGQYSQLKLQNSLSADAARIVWDDTFAMNAECGEAEISLEKNTDGSASLDVSLSTSSETESGTFKVELNGNITYDKDGNISGSGEINGTFRW